MDGAELKRQVCEGGKKTTAEECEGGQKMDHCSRLGCRPETVTSGRQTCFELQKSLGAPSLVHKLTHILGTRGPCRSLLFPIEQGALSSRELLSQE